MIKQTLGEVLEKKVTLDVKGIDRLYLNLYQPLLRTGGGGPVFRENSQSDHSPRPLTVIRRLSQCPRPSPGHGDPTKVDS
jgi:hypothetical protein